jgi:hypothetical protein
MHPISEGDLFFKRPYKKYPSQGQAKNKSLQTGNSARHGRNQFSHEFPTAAEKKKYPTSPSRLRPHFCGRDKMAWQANGHESTPKISKIMR